MILTINTLEIQDCQIFNLIGTIVDDNELNNDTILTITNLTTNEIKIFIGGVDYNITNDNGSISLSQDYGSSLIDGIYQVNLAYYLPGTTTLITEDEQCVLSLCQVCCKVKKLATKVVIKDCGNCNEDNNKDILKFLEADALLIAIQYGGACGSITEINKNIENLQEFLLNINCKNC